MPCFKNIINSQQLTSNTMNGTLNSNVMAMVHGQTISNFSLTSTLSFFNNYCANNVNDIQFP